MLNYETKWMNREELVSATYDAGERLNALKLEYGRIERTRGEGVARRIAQARELRHRLEVESNGVRQALRGDIRKFSISTVCDKTELFWPRHAVNFHLLPIVRSAMRVVL
jgi:hypothetical protein